MGGSGSVSYLFDRRGVFVIPAASTTEDALMNVVLEAGGEDLKLDGENFVVTCEVTAFNTIQAALEAAGITPESAEMEQVPKSLMEVDVETGKKVVKLLDILDDYEDVQTVFCNANITPEMVEEE